MPTRQSRVNASQAVCMRTHNLIVTQKFIHQFDRLYTYVKYNRYDFNRRLLILPYRVLMTLLTRYRNAHHLSKHAANGQVSIDGAQGKQLPDGSYFKLTFDSDTANIDFSLTEPSFRATLPHMFTTSIVWATLKPVKHAHSEALTAQASDVHGPHANCQKVIDIFLSYLYAVYTSLKQHAEMLAADERRKERVQVPEDLRLKHKIAAGPYSFKKLFGMPPKQFFNQ